MVNNALSVIRPSFLGEMRWVGHILSYYGSGIFLLASILGVGCDGLLPNGIDLSRHLPPNEAVEY